jgi:uncharacterized protein YndB with AHSA1/START domain
MTNATPATVRVTHRFAASPERVYDAWLTPEAIARWMVGPAGGEMRHIAVDARVGGRFSFVIHRGGEDLDHTGEYMVVERPHHLAFTWGVPKYSAESTRVDLAVAPDGPGALLTLTHSGVAPEYAERTTMGWTRILGAIAEVLSH